MTEIDALNRQAVLYNLIEQLRQKDNWCGETHVQKAAYFLEELAGRKLGYCYILYKHGPYSFELSEDLSTMWALHFIGDELVNPNYGPRLKPNPEVAQMLRDQFGDLANRLRPALHFVVEKLGGYGVVPLERIATALYFTVHEHVDGEEQRAQRINEVKPHITVSLALDAVKEVNRILGEWKAIQRSGHPARSP